MKSMTRPKFTPGGRMLSRFIQLGRASEWRGLSPAEKKELESLGDEIAWAVNEKIEQKDRELRRQTAWRKYGRTA